MIEADLLKTLLINPSDNRTHFKANCPVCGKEKHFYINKNTGLWDCKKCGEKGNIVSFLMQLGQLSLLDGKPVDLENPLKSLEERIQAQQIEAVDVEIKRAKLPIGFKPVAYGDDNQYGWYLKKRKFTEIDFLLYGAGYTDLKRKYKDYVIIPVTRDNEVKAYVTRYIGEDEDKPRYLNSEHDFAKLLFGYDELHEDTHTAILTEGAFDKVSVTTELNLHYNNYVKCLGTFGKKISDAQLYLLKTKGIENLIFMYDGRDAVNDMKRIAGEIAHQFRNILITYTGVLDPGASDKNQIQQYLNEAKTPDVFKLDKVNKLKLK